ncbi:hypothetical protein [Ruminococcus gauvreauii]|uniref:hypothetical protein n=1 Tax=Ruminococcus gauvreauii TaxID=438033 RepID=UPI003984195E
MVDLYYGGSDSGVDVDVERWIRTAVSLRAVVITNFELQYRKFQGNDLDYYHYVTLKQLTPEYLIAFMKSYSKRRRGAFHVFLKDCGSLFGTEVPSEWMDFFLQLRSLGAVVHIVSGPFEILCGQLQGLIDDCYFYYNSAPYSILYGLFGLISYKQIHMKYSTGVCYDKRSRYFARKQKCEVTT